MPQPARLAAAGSGTCTIVLEIESTDPLAPSTIVPRIQSVWIGGRAMVVPAPESITDSAQVPLPGVGLAWRSSRLANMSV